MAEVMMLDYILTRWRAKPDQPKSAYTAIHNWQDGSIENEWPLAEGEVNCKKARLRQISPGTYFRIFPEEHRGPEAEPGAAADGGGM